MQAKKQDSEYNIEEVIIKYRPIIGFRVKRSLGTQTPDWEDVVNEIVINIVEKLKEGKFRGESSLGTFIYTITSRRIIDYIRQKTKVLKHAPEPPDFPKPEELIEDQQRAEHMAEAIRKLKPKYKEILHLYYYKDLTRDEVAQKLNISPRRVSERVNYAQKLLKKVIKQ